MAWIYLDDSIATHPRIVRAGVACPVAPWLFVAGLGYCRKHLTAGVIPAAVVPSLTPLFKTGAAKALVGAGLWEELRLPESKDVESYVVHDYDQWNSGEDAQRVARVQRARKAAAARWATR